MNDKREDAAHMNDTGERDWPIHTIARLAGTSSRTLRHYDAIGLLHPSRVGENAYRYYDQETLVRLQRILLLRELGLSLPTIGEVLGRETDEDAALRQHLEWLRAEQDQLARRIAAVEMTVLAQKEGEQLMAEDMFDGFDHTAHKDEVEQRWGMEAYAQGDSWWRSLTAGQRSEFQARQRALAAEWVDAASAGLDPASARAQELAARQVDWLGGVPGTPRSESGALPKEYVVGLGELYVADPRFAGNYGGVGGAEFVRDAMKVYAERAL